MIDTILDNEVVPPIVQVNATSFANQWQFLPVGSLTPKAQDKAHRLNCLGSMYYFGKLALKKHRLTPHLHKDMCDNLEKDYLKEVIQIPRDHFKTTVHSEIAPMWWALPFTPEDERYMRALGYDDAWIRWMKKSHDPDTRTMTVSENIKNACKIGRRIDYHYTNNLLFKRLFPEIQPDSSTNWSVETMTHKRSSADVGQGEGTYDYIGVGGALQSRHYKRIIQDDLVGKEALGSEIIMADTIDYHKLLPGAFDSNPNDPENDNDEVVVGNRWSYRDLNHYIAGNEPEFHLTSHSALGGCCSKHLPGKVIFPEEWSEKKLERWKNRFGAYFFSCQFLNTPTPPGDTKFKEGYLNYYTYGTLSPMDRRVILKHNVQAGGLVIKDVLPSSLQRSMLLDPNHAGDEGRCNHAIVVTGFNAVPIRVYLLDLYAKNSSHADLVHEFFVMSEKWKIRDPWVETVGAQKWLKFHLNTENENRRKLGKWTFDRINEFKKDSSKDAKIHRIESMEPMFRQGQFWMLKYGHEQFKSEYLEYPYAATRDIMDVLGYATQTFDMDYMTDKDMMAFIHKNQTKFKSHGRSESTGY